MFKEETGLQQTYIEVHTLGIQFDKKKFNSLKNFLKHRLLTQRATQAKFVTFVTLFYML